ncbi:MAG: copper oxidase [Xanthobacteraceae bacterium]|nr:MAG: copper oxidase [Xanthobacteraceae bacterium]
MSPRPPSRFLQPEVPVPLTRRMVMGGLGAAALACGLPALAAAPRMLEARPAEVRLRGPGEPATTIWSFDGVTPGPTLRVNTGETLDLALANRLPGAIAFAWHGLPLPPAGLPLTGREPLPPGSDLTLNLTPRQAGTFLYHARLIDDGATLPLPAGALIVDEATPPATERDELLLIEDWRLDADGRALPPGRPLPQGTQTLFTVNGTAAQDIAVRAGDRLRLRLVNGCARALIAVMVERHDVRVIALDGQPAEPFPARNGRLLLAPGGRADVIIDASGAAASSAAIILHDGVAPRTIARLVYDAEPGKAVRADPPPPLPGNGLPARLDLKGALRIEASFDGLPNAGWMPPGRLGADDAPLFRARRGRAVVLAFTNRGSGLAVLHLHGHHFRLLDRLDDGWKPFWLDTVAVDGGSTIRIALAAGTPGPWLIEAFAADWAQPRLARWFAVE